jgi:hypothetical protein
VHPSIDPVSALLNQSGRQQGFTGIQHYMPSNPTGDIYVVHDQELITNSSTERPKANQDSETRRQSLDALRGFDMFWIAGGDAWATSLLSRFPSSTNYQLKLQFEHVDWQGC